MEVPKSKGLKRMQRWTKETRKLQKVFSLSPFSFVIVREKTVCVFQSCFIAEKGVPSFWLTALKNNDVISEEVSLAAMVHLELHQSYTWKMTAVLFSFDIRSQSVMKGPSYILKISSGARLKSQKDSSLSFSSIRILTLKTPY